MSKTDGPRPPSHFAAYPVRAPRELLDLLKPPPGVRLMHAEDLHVTVAFFGPLEPELAARVQEGVARLPPPPSTVSFWRLEGLPTAHRPSAFAFALRDGRDELAAVIAEHRDALLALGRRAPESRDPLPHVTVARPSRRISTAERREAVRWAEGLVPPDLPVLVRPAVLFRGRREAVRGDPRYEVVPSP